MTLGCSRFRVCEYYGICCVRVLGRLGVLGYAGIRVLGCSGLRVLRSSGLRVLRYSVFGYYGIKALRYSCVGPWRSGVRSSVMGGFGS